MDAPSPKHSPIPEQWDIITATTSTSDHLMVNASAGTGKTTTLEMMATASQVRPWLYLSFNTRNADEAEKRFPPWVKVKTLNALGSSILYSRRHRTPKLSKTKVRDLLREMITESPKRAQGPMWDRYWEVVNGVSMAKALGYVPEGKFPSVTPLADRFQLFRHLDEQPDSLTSDLIDEVLVRSTVLAFKGSVDFDDQVYLPALWSFTFPRFPHVAVDEYQDLNPVNHAMIRKLTRHSRLFGVGDPFQSIYAFRGAEPQGMAQAVQRYGMKEFPLSTSFRCPQAVVELARWRVPDFKWLKPGGIVGRLRNPTLGSFPDGAALLCRNNAPILALAMKLLGGGRSVRVAGSDIGPRLVGLMRKLGDEELNRSQTLGAIEEWRMERLAKSSTTANDMADCMRVFALQGDSLGQAIAYANHLFKQQGTLHLLTGHKAKGMEWSMVYHLDPWLIRSDEQDLNLHYVIQTRTLCAYHEVLSEEIPSPR